MKRKFKVDMFFTYLVLTLMAATFMLPLIWMLRSSLMGMKQIFRLPPEWIPDPFVWKNFSDALSRLDFLQCFKNTIFVVFFGVLEPSLPRRAPPMLGRALSGRVEIFGLRCPCPA